MAAGAVDTPNDAANTDYRAGHVGRNVRAHERIATEKAQKRTKMQDKQLPWTSCGQCPRAFGRTNGRIPAPRDSKMERKKGKDLKRFHPGHVISATERHE